MYSIGYCFTTKSGCTFEVTGYAGDKYEVSCIKGPPYTTNVSRKTIRNSSIKNPNLPSVFGIGYIGEGYYNYKSKFNSRSYYSFWQRMLERCSSSYQDLYPTYKNVTCDPSWLNFQNFCMWMDKQNSAEGLVLDKDLLVPKNKVYSPDTCTLLPPRINAFVASGLYVTGVRERSSGSYQVRCTNAEGKRLHIGEYLDYKEAKQTYIDYKNLVAKDLSNKFKNLICDEAYKALSSYDINRYT